MAKAEMTEADRQEIIQMLNKSKVIAQDVMKYLADKCDDPREATTVATMLFTTCVLACEMTLHDGMGLFMEMYRSMEAKAV